MECETVRELLGNYIDEDLIDTMRRKVDKHLMSCKTCRADLTTLSETVQSLTKATPVEEASPWFAERLLHRIAQQNDISLTDIELPAKNLQLGLW